MSEGFQGLGCRLEKILAKQYVLKGRWLTNASPESVMALPGGKDYSVAGTEHPNTILGRPCAVANGFVQESDAFEALGIVGVYEHITNLKNLPREPSDKSIFEKKPPYRISDEYPFQPT